MVYAGTNPYRPTVSASAITKANNSFFESGGCKAQVRSVRFIRRLLLKYKPINCNFDSADPIVLQHRIDFDMLESAVVLQQQHSLAIVRQR